ncbi:MAG: rhodanese-like domain-containing protein [Candidatus Sumerlaeaceae bacterium]|nr:rhodanese-like domain-containing protein [Candidatus Sumerlaeaceae bacterium]
MAFTCISANELAGVLNRDPGAILIDVRTPGEYQTAHVPQARLMPLADLNPDAVRALRNGREDAPIHVICQAGGRSRQACEKLAAAGITNLVNVEGGTAGWIKAGLPVQRGKRSMSVECQVRVAMGSLVLVGCAVGAFVHPAGLLLTAFVGCGMIYAGIMDDCPMANWIARMPWNAGAPVSCSTRAKNA